MSALNSVVHAPLFTVSTQPAAKSNFRYKITKAMTRCEKQFRQKQNIIKTFYTSTIILPSIKKNNGDKRPWLQWVSTQ